MSLSLDAAEVGEHLAKTPPDVSLRKISVTAKIDGTDLSGVVISHGGAALGYSIAFVEGRPMLSFRNRGELIEVTSPDKLDGLHELTAEFDQDFITLSVDGKQVAQAKSSGFLPSQPAAGVHIGQMKGKAVGSYKPPFPFNGRILAIGVKTEKVERVMPPLDPNVSRPDIVILLSDDHTWRDSSVYGSPDIQTPNMERLAKQGMTFNRAYVTTSSCAPSRASLLTGLYPARNGSEANHSRIREGIASLPKSFFDLGYEVVSFGKVGHYAQTPEWGFDVAMHYNYHEDVAIPSAVEWLKQRTSKRPLVMFVGTNWPHVPWPSKDFDPRPEQQVVPPNHVDNDTTRQKRAQYHAAIQNMDRDLGLLFDAVQETLGEKTFFLHTSDHGAQWPFGKWNLYEDSVHTPLIVSWPGKIAENVRTDAMVSWIDILPTVLEVAGGKPPEGLDGRSFLPVLEGKEKSHRDLIFTTHSGDGNNNVYPIRAVTTSDGWQYVRNLHPEFLFTSHVTNVQADTGYWNSWLKSAETDPAAKLKVFRYQQRPAEELYYIPDDPYELNNLANDPKAVAKLQELRVRLDQWLRETDDQLQVYGTPKLISAP
ncbi:sulfatase-like hydrolase/transferase [Planctomicrobium sp. SH668]|uniref:sulfatase-like hydrolase/transferase n=1 Tax=Planctomicrobium sp. SH668 TaxID=3448126 RepID=UPI003F5AE5DA